MSELQMFIRTINIKTQIIKNANNSLLLKNQKGFQSNNTFLIILMYFDNVIYF